MSHPVAVHTRRWARIDSRLTLALVYDRRLTTLGVSPKLAGISLYGPAVTQDSFAPPSATQAAARNAHQWTPQSHLEA
jgi:hypothetical protein